MNLQILKKAINEFRVYPQMVKNKTGDRNLKLYWQLDMLWCLLKYGARPVDYYRFEFYKFNRFERNKYFTFYRYLKVARQLINSGVIFADKAKEYQKYSEFISRNWMTTKGSTNQALKSFVETNEPCIAKPNGGEQGKGIFVVTLNSLTENPNILGILAKENYILEEKLVNCEQLDVINHSSLNTIRVYSMTDKNGCPHILNMMLRVGKSGSDVDNWGAGGVGYEVDLNHGIVRGCGVDKKGNRHLKHPGTNIVMLGFKIPQFNEVTRMVEKLCTVDTRARLVGWDIALTPKGPELIEMNCPAGHDFLQAFGTPFYDKIKELW